MLEKSGTKVDFILDNIGTPAALYWQAPKFTKSGAKYVQIGSQISLGSFLDLARRFVPAWLGGGQRPFAFQTASSNSKDFEALAGLVAEGKVKPVIDEVFEFGDVPQAYKKLKTERARGKIVIRVVSDS